MRGVQLTTEEFIQRARKIHGNKYDYSNVEYNNTHGKINIVCKLHGVFSQTAGSHLNGCGCSTCTNKKQYNTTTFIQKAKDVHGNKYDYSKVKYINAYTKVCIICYDHGEFSQTPGKHLGGNGCNACGNMNIGYKLRHSKNTFIQKARIIHGNKYDYSKVKYINALTKVTIMCVPHGEFYTTPNNHLSKKSGCPLCKSSKGETKTADILIKNNIIFNKEMIFNNCKNKRPLPFDFYLPELNICIEYDGIQHFKPIDFWGGEDGFRQQQVRDSIKTKYCKDNNIKLIRIRYDENINEKLAKII